MNNEVKRETPGVIMAHVPVSDPRHQPKKRGPKPGWKKEAKKAEPDKVLRPGVCRGCESGLTVLTYELLCELVKSARDRLADTDSAHSGKAAEHDLEYMTARIAGYCSLSCRRDNG